MTQGSDYITAQVLSIGVLIGSFLSYIPQTLAVVATTLVIIHYIILIRESRSWTAWKERHKIFRAAGVARSVVQTEAALAVDTIHLEAAKAVEVVKEQATAVADNLRGDVP